MIKKITQYLYALIWPLLLYFVSESVIRSSVNAFMFRAGYVPFIAHLINYLLFFLAVNLFQWIRNRAFFLIYQLWMNAFILVFALVSGAKSSLRMEPLLPSDIRYFRDALNAAKGYIANLDTLLWVGPLILVMLSIALFLLFRYKTRPGIPINVFISSLLILTGSFIYVYAGKNAFPRSFIRQFYKESYSLMVNAEKNGTAFHLLEYISNHHSRPVPPDGYSSDTILALITDYTPETPAQLPDIILVLGESMIDITQITELNLKDDPIPNIREAMDRFGRGVMTVQTFGGGTGVAESAILTGMRSDPYMPRHFDTIAWQLKQLGYTTTAIHSYWGWFYDRHVQMKHMGFDKYIPLEAMTKQPVFNPYPLDTLLYDQILETLHASEGPHLIYAAGMQTHGGYGYTPKYDTAVISSSLPPSASEEINNYLYQLKSADQALGDFLDVLSDELVNPTVVVFFADHYPAIPFTLGALGIHSTDSRLFEMPFFVWSNFGFQIHETGPIPDYELTSHVFSALGLPLTLYQRHVHDPDTYQLLIYDAQFGANYAHQAVSEYRLNELYQFGRAPSVKSASLEPGKRLHLFGEEITWRATIECGSVYELVKFNTDGHEASAVISDKLYRALTEGTEARLRFVDDGERPFSETTFSIP